MHQASRMMIKTFMITQFLLIATGASLADDTSQPTVTSESSLADIRDAAKRSIQLIESSTAKYLEQRQCSSCHHQTLSLIVFVEARRVGIPIDKDNFESQRKRIYEYHIPRLDGYLAAKDMGEQVHTPGYGLWGLDVAGHPSDELTAAIVRYLLHYQSDQGHWSVGLDRRPAEASDLTTNYLAVRGLHRYGVESQQARIAERVMAVRDWLPKAPIRDTEDRVFRLRLAHELGYSKEQLTPYARDLLAEQHANGGWSQTSDRPSDAYATGSVLVALHDSGQLSTKSTVWRRGIDYLLKTQQSDGSWHVATRAIPMQEYFESGFPHGKDQFISAFGTGWATKALLISLPRAN